MIQWFTQVHLLRYLQLLAWEGGQTLLGQEHVPYHLIYQEPLGLSKIHALGEEGTYFPDYAWGDVNVTIPQSLNQDRPRQLIQLSSMSYIHLVDKKIALTRRTT